jgi:S1-C subfamily serine protease
MRLLLLKLPVWLGLVVSATATQASPLPDVIDFIRGGVVAVGSYMPTRAPQGEFRGTGFVIGDGTLVVTNYHVLPLPLDSNKNEQVAVFSGRGKRAKLHLADVLASDPVHDLALLRIENGPLPALRLTDSNQLPREGSPIALTGFPIGMVLGLYPVTHTGIVSAISPVAIPQNNSKQLTSRIIKAMRDPYEVIQLDATAYPGNSGSPVYDPTTGRVLGVVNSVLVKDTKESALERPTGISYAIPAQFVKALLAGAGTR